MNEQGYSELTDEKLLIEKKKLKKKKFINALIIGFLASIVVVGIVSGFLASKKNFIVLLLPMLFPIYFIYLIIKKSKNDKGLEIVLKKRNLN